MRGPVRTHDVRYRHKDTVRRLNGQAKGEMTENLPAKSRRSGSVASLVNPAYPSQIAPRTGLWLGERRGDRIYGTDGAVLDVATNVACNIRDRLHDKEIT